MEREGEREGGGEETECEKREACAEHCPHVEQ